MDTVAEITQIKKDYGDRLCLLAHYYQRDEVYRLADVSGDSYQLALAASRSRAEHIVFCGVSFMAESARILARPDQHVYLPDFKAGCPLADMLDPADFEQALTELADQAGRAFVPVVYINSSAAVKAVAARAGGIACTSSNAALLVRSLLAEGRAVFFLPDMNLGLNTARLLSLAEGETIVFGRKKPRAKASGRVKMAVWDGFCNVHVRFSVSDVRKAKNLYPYARIIVHPECPPEVVALADYAGSTSGIIKETERAQAGDVLFIGTEQNLVRRLANGRRDAKIFPLRESGCVNMNKITLDKLLAALRAIGRPPSPFEVSVPAAVQAAAKGCLSGMIERVEREKPS